MKPLTEKVLKSGLVDKHMAEMLEKWGNLPEGAADLVNDNALKDATREQLTKLGEELGDEVDKLRTLRETQLDLDKIRWPVSVTVIDDKGTYLVHDLAAVIDRMGRIYFRIQDVREEWLVPGYLFERLVINKDVPPPPASSETPTLLNPYAHKKVIREQILEKSVLYTDNSPVCFQVSVHPLA